MLNKPVTQGMTEFILKQEKMEARLEIESSGGSSSDKDGSSSGGDSSHSSFNRSSTSKLSSSAAAHPAAASRRGSISNQRRQQYGIDLAEFERKGAAKDKQTKDALLNKLQEK